MSAQQLDLLVDTHTARPTETVEDERLTQPSVKVRRDAQPTSVNAALQALPKSGTNRDRVLRAIRRFGERGLTDQEIAEYLGMSENSTRPRRLELEEGLFIQYSGRTRKTKGGADARVYIATSKGLGLS